MKFEQALALMRQGKKVALQGWQAGICLSIENGEIALNDPEDKIEKNEEFMANGDLLSDKWYVIETLVLLSDKERLVLASAIQMSNALNGRIQNVTKYTSYDKQFEYLDIEVMTEDNCEELMTPSFRKGELFKQLKAGREYLLKELGLENENK